MAAAAATTTTELTHPSGARASVHLYGATVTAFYAADEPTRNVLFVSKRAALDGSKPIRGGIPLVFPIFGSADGFPNHGLVRTSTKWTLTQLDVSEASNADAPTVATFKLTSDESTRAIWPFEFALTYEVKLFAQTLVTALHVENTSTSELSFHALLHTYVAVDDIRNVTIHGLHGLHYMDKVTGATAVESREALTIDCETDSVYMDAPSQLTVRLGSTNKQRSVTIDKAAFVDHEPRALAGTQPSDAVVWNPWSDKAKSMSDFGDDEFYEMVCVEPGCVSQKQALAPGRVFTLQQSITTTAAPSSL